MPATLRYCLSVAGLTIAIETDTPHEILPQFRPFLTECSEPDCRVVFRQVTQLAAYESRILYEDSCYRVHPDGAGGLVRVFFDAPKDYTPYAASSCDASCDNIRVEYLEKGTSSIADMHSAFFYIGLEALLIRKGRLCLHASCVQTQLGGLLFSGKSGIGKSTQAELWCRYRNAVQINGDRPILGQGTGGWQAWGSPYAGSSRCYVNESCPVTAVIMLRQEKNCTLRRLSPADAFRAIWSGLTMHSWDAEQVEAALNLAMGLTSAVPVFEFGCTPDEAAVKYLERELQRECKK